MATNNDVSVVKTQNNALMNRYVPVATMTPPADIFETEDAFVVMLDMPGSAKESISITLDKSSLVVRGSVEESAHAEAKKLYSEITGGAYQRSFNLSDSIDRDTVDARYENGVLTLKLFKKEEVKPRVIAIQ